MNMKVLMQALKFACLPTLSVLILLFFGFFSIDKTIGFIASDNGWAIALRVALVIAEFGLIWYMYDHYLIQFNKEENKRLREEAIMNNNKGLKGRPLNSYYEVRQLFQGADRDDNFVIYDTDVPEIKVVELTKKKKV